MMAVVVIVLAGGEQRGPRRVEDEDILHSGASGRVSLRDLGLRLTLSSTLEWTRLAAYAGGYNIVHKTGQSACVTIMVCLAPVTAGR